MGFTSFMFIPDQNWQVIPMNNSSPATTACTTQQPIVTHNHAEILVQAMFMVQTVIAGRAVMEEQQAAEQQVVITEQVRTGLIFASTIETLALASTQGTSNRVHTLQALFSCKVCTEQGTLQAFRGPQTGIEQGNALQQTCKQQQSLQLASSSKVPNGSRSLGCRRSLGCLQKRAKQRGGVGKAGAQGRRAWRMRQMPSAPSHLSAHSNPPITPKSFPSNPEKVEDRTSRTSP